VRAPVDVNKEEFLWNNDFGRNDFLSTSDAVCLAGDRIFGWRANLAKHD
jgi:hypothetical protein